MQPALDIRAMHIHHGLLDKADSWLDHCQNVSSALAIPYQSIKLTIENTAGKSLEEVARQARYQALIRALEPQEVLLTAHHLNDQSETLLLQLFRGAGVNGLAAMAPIMAITDNNKLARPFLSVSRTSLEEYAKEHKLAFIEDPSNADQSFDRNYCRHQLMPLLRQRWKGVDKAIARSASIQAETRGILDEVAAADLEECASANRLCLNINQLNQLSLPRQRLLIRYWITQAGFLAPSEKKLKHLFSDVIQASDDAQPLLEWTGAQLRRYQDWLYIMPPLSTHDTTQVLNWDTQEPLYIESLGMKLLFDQLNIKKLAEYQQSHPEKGSVTVRFRQGGEQIYSAKHGKTISLKTYLQATGVPPWLRSRLPLIYIDGKLVEVTGLEQ